MAGQQPQAFRLYRKRHSCIKTRWWRNQNELWDEGGWEKHNSIWTDSFTSQFQRTNIWALSRKSSEGCLTTLSSRPQWLERKQKGPQSPSSLEREQGSTCCRSHTVSRFLKKRNPFLVSNRKKTQDETKPDLGACHKENPKECSERSTDVPGLPLILCLCTGGPELHFPPLVSQLHRSRDVSEPGLPQWLYSTTPGPVHIYAPCLFFTQFSQ